VCREEDVWNYEKLVPGILILYGELFTFYVSFSFRSQSFFLMRKGTSLNVPLLDRGD
jgi:hypothetical protein